MYTHTVYLKTKLALTLMVMYVLTSKLFQKRLFGTTVASKLVEKLPVIQPIFS